MTEHRLTHSTYTQGGTTVLTYRCSGCQTIGHLEAETERAVLIAFAAVAAEHNTPSLFDLEAS